MTMRLKQYFPEIDGLRAIAVMSVVIHHVSSQLLPGGFVGVDIFFVISGFLITSQVYEEIRTASFSLAKFYQRRINRIVPALLAMISVCLIVGAFILSPADLTRLSSSAFLALIGFSNVYFWNEYGNYFSGDTGEAILLHTWSLGVEEQFYLIWPLFVLFLTKLAPRHVLFILTVLTLLTISFSEYLIGIAASASYYLLPTRIFELTIGGLLAVGLAQKCMLIPRFLSSLCKVVGFSLIVYAVFMLTRESPFPGLNALLPCLGSALLILAIGSGHASPILSSKPVVFIGLISYSLYLWHWPVIAYLNYVNVSIDPAVGLLVVAVAILLAWLSWRYVEQPCRRSGAVQSFGRIFVRRFAIPALLLLSLGMLSLWFNGFPQRFSPQVASWEAMAATKPEVLRSGCHVPAALYYREPNAKCKLGTGEPRVDGILIGDSYANHFTGMVDVLAKADGVSLMDYTMDGCPPIVGHKAIKAASYAKKCELRNAHVLELLQQNRYRYVVLAASWPRDEDVEKAIETMIWKIVGTGSQVIIILSNQHIDKAVSCPVKGLIFHSWRICSVPQVDAPSYWVNIKSRFPEARFIDPDEVICSSRMCNSVIESTLLYRDGSHLNDVGSRLIGRILLRKGHSLLHTSD